MSRGSPPSAGAPRPVELVSTRTARVPAARDLGPVHAAVKGDFAPQSPAAAGVAPAVPIYSAGGARLARGDARRKHEHEVRGQGLEAAGRDQGRARPALHAALLRLALRGAVGQPYAGSGDARRAAARPRRRRSSSSRPRPTAIDVLGGGSATARISARATSSTRSTPRPATTGSRRWRSISTSSPAAARRAIADVGEALDRVRRAGKPVVAYATGYDDDSYQLAAHADEVWLDPLGAVLIAGPGGTNLYYAGPARAARHHRQRLPGRHLQVGGRALSPAATCRPRRGEALQALADALWETWQQDVRQARPKAQLAAYVADPGARIAARRRRHGAGGAAGRAGRPDRRPHRLRPAHGRARRHAATRRVPDSFRAVDYDAWIDGQSGQRRRRRDRRSSPSPATIVDGEAGLGTAGAETIVRSARARACASGNLKALVVRVDSPRRLGARFRADPAARCSPPRRRGIPVVVSMGSVAASGGYWIATAGDTIFAEPRRSPARSACSASCRASRAR